MSSLESFIKILTVYHLIDIKGEKLMNDIHRRICHIADEISLRAAYVQYWTSRAIVEKNPKHNETALNHIKLMEELIENRYELMGNLK